MSEFERQQPSFRLAQTHHGDDLQAVAHREMGDANRWPELIWLNGLSHPFLTDDPAVAGAGVILNGALIKVPAPRGVFTDEADGGQVYERDCRMENKLLTDDGFGDFSVVSGVANLSQQLTHRLNTPRGQARRHPEYGCLVWRLRGTVNGPIAGALGAQHVRAALKADYRVSDVKSASAAISGDAIRITAKAVAIAGSSIDLIAG